MEDFAGEKHLKVP